MNAEAARQLARRWQAIARQHLAGKDAKDDLCD
jgi:hypothetical protein